jgi:hypothetical protein
MPVATAYAEEVLDGQEPAEAMANWIQAVCEHARTYRGIAIGVVMDDAGADAHAAGDRLLVKAQRAGVVRPDVTPTHIAALAQGLVRATEDDPALLDGLLSVVLDGLSG